MELQGHTSPDVENILRRDSHAKIRGDFIPWKKLQQYQVKLVEVKIKPIDLPKPSPLKGGHEKIRKKNLGAIKRRHYRKRRISFV